MNVKFGKWIRFSCIYNVLRIFVSVLEGGRDRGNLVSRERNQKIDDATLISVATCLLS